MYIILEYSICAGLVFVAGTLLFGACTALLLIQEAGRLMEGFIGTLMRSGVPVVRPANHLRMWVGQGEVRKSWTP